MNCIPELLPAVRGRGEAVLVDDGVLEEGAPPLLRLLPCLPEGDEARRVAEEEGPADRHGGRVVAEGQLDLPWWIFNRKISA